MTLLDIDPENGTEFYFDEESCREVMWTRWGWMIESNEWEESE